MTEEICPKGWCPLARTDYPAWQEDCTETAVGCNGLCYSNGDRLDCVTGDYEAPEVWCPVFAHVANIAEAKAVSDGSWGANIGGANMEGASDLFGLDSVKRAAREHAEEYGIDDHDARLYKWCVETIEKFVEAIARAPRKGWKIVAVQRGTTRLENFAIGKDDWTVNTVPTVGNPFPDASRGRPYFDEIDEAYDFAEGGDGGIQPEGDGS